MRLEFSESTKQLIGQQAMFICAASDCFRLTGYGTTDGKVKSIAQAAHINAASKGGPRANHNLTKTYLKSWKNGIWLCSICHKKIDDDPNFYTTELLKDWKLKHQEVVRRIAGKDLESALLDLRNQKRYHDETREFFSFLEDRRVLYEGMDYEFPPRVLESLELIRARIVHTRARVNPDTKLFRVLNHLQTAIGTFLRNIGPDTDLKTLRCDGKDPKWRQFAEEVHELRRVFTTIIQVLADDADYKLTWIDTLPKA